MKLYKIQLMATLFFILFTQVLFSRSFEIQEEGFYKEGRSYRVLSGSLDYARIAKQDWNDRLLKARAMGLNTISTAVYWNFHETEEGLFDFSTGNKNLKLFLKLAQDNQLNVILKVGPYVASDWDLGGLPSWLLAKPTIQLRSSDELFLSYVKKYFEALNFAIEGLCYSEGGPVILIQIEKEYGSYGNDKNYLSRLFELATASGLKSPLFTIDLAKPTHLKTGNKAGAFPTIVLSKRPQKDFHILEQFDSKSAFMAGEFPITQNTYQDDRFFKDFSLCKEKQILLWLLKNNKSFNIHSFHAGSDLGAFSGAIKDKGGYHSIINGNHWFAPLTEGGDITYEYRQLRKILEKHQNLNEKELPPIPPNSKKISSVPIRFRHYLALSDFFRYEPIRSPMPLSMEACGVNTPFIAYRTNLHGEKEGELQIKEPKDIAYIYFNKRFLGKISHNDRSYSIKLPAIRKKEEPELLIVVEQKGRLSAGANLMDYKGITNQVTLNGINVMNWEIFPLPFTEEFLANLHYEKDMIYLKPAIFAATFQLRETGDCYFDIRRWSSGMVMVNGHNLGRYGDRSAQKKVFCPAEYLQKGENTIFLFDAGMENLPTLYISRYR